MGSRPSTSTRPRPPGGEAAAVRSRARANGAPAGEPQGGSRVRSAAIKADRLAKSFGQDVVLKAVSFALAPGELLEVTGPTGSGKTTLLRLLHGQLRPSAGELWLDERALHRRWRRGVQEMRRETAFVFQDQRLLSRLTALENVVLALLVREPELPYATIRERASRALESVGLSRKRNRVPEQLSGGERQRVALARALVTSPRVLLVDEPFTGLDEDAAAKVMRLLEEAAAAGSTVVVATHRHVFRSARVLRLPEEKLTPNGSRRTAANGNGHVKSGPNGHTTGDGGPPANGHAVQGSRPGFWAALLKPRRASAPRRSMPAARPVIRRIAALGANAFRLVVWNGLRGWRRDFKLTAPVMGTIAVLLVLWGTLAMVGISMAKVASDQAADASLLRVYLAPNVSPDQIASLVSTLDADSRVASVTQVSPEEALAQASSHPGLDTLASLTDTNPFPASLDVRVKQISQLAGVSDLVQNDPAVDPSYPTSYDPDTYGRIRRLALTVGAIGGALLLLFAIVGYVVVANSMRGIASARRDEVAVTRLLGARGWMLRGPFVMGGLTTGALGGAMAGAVVAGVWIAAQRFQAATFAQVLPGITQTSAQYVIAGVVVAGLLVGSATAWLGFRKVRV